MDKGACYSSVDSGTRKWLVIEQNMDTAPVPQFKIFAECGESSIAITKTGARFRQVRSVEIVAKPSVQ